MSEHDQLVRLLLGKGLIDRSQLAEAIERQNDTGAPLSRVLIDMRAITQSQLVATVAAQLGLTFVELADYPIDPTAATLIPESLCRRYQALPIGYEEGRLVVAMADPSNVVALDDIRRVTSSEVKAVVSTREAIEEAINRQRRLDGEVEDVTAQLAEELAPEDDLESAKEVTDDAPIVRLANLIITQAVQDRASDIHIEPTETDLRVRYRVDGVLHEVGRYEKRVQAGLISRLKIMAELNIADKRVPQDGRISVGVAGKAVDLRVATLPTVYGEKVVMRILDNSTALLRLEDLGFLSFNMEQYSEALDLPYGTILVTGPTGSGKSTTLYSSLNRINDSARNVITVEDPVEYRLRGINQIQVNKKAGLTFESALRTILRSDPDIILVGEIRDRETAMIAMEAALTGHLVLSTLHTNDSTSTPTRLVEMGLEPFLVSSALNCIVAQRLARRLCERCKEPYEPTGPELTSAGWDRERYGENPTIFKPVGCSSCARTGYSGRMALHEVLTVTEEVSGLIAERAHSGEIKKVAISQGMLTLRAAGLAQVANGATSLEEVFRVVA